MHTLDTTPSCWGHQALLLLLSQETRKHGSWCWLLETAELDLSSEPPANPSVRGRTCFLTTGSKQETRGFVICLLPGIALVATSQVCHSCVPDRQLLMFKNHSFISKICMVSAPPGSRALLYCSGSSLLRPGSGLKFVCKVKSESVI